MNSISFFVGLPLRLGTCKLLSDMIKFMAFIAANGNIKPTTLLLFYPDLGKLIFPQCRRSFTRFYFSNRLPTKRDDANELPSMERKCFSNFIFLCFTCARLIFMVLTLWHIY